MYQHFEEVHNINMKWEHHEFQSLNDFQIWKEAQKRLLWLHMLNLELGQTNTVYTNIKEEVSDTQRKMDPVRLIFSVYQK